jgi:hypothetical protein
MHASKLGTKAEIRSLPSTSRSQYFMKRYLPPPPPKVSGVTGEPLLEGQSVVMIEVGVFVGWEVVGELCWCQCCLKENGTLVAGRPC